MKNLEERTHRDVMTEARAIVSERRASYNDALRSVTQRWKADLADEIAARLIDETTMTMEQMTDVFRRIDEALEGMRLEAEFVVHVDNVCYELCAGTVTL